MNCLRLGLFVTVMGLCVGLCSSQTHAWEFSMQGAFAWELEELSQTGTNGFFGPYDVDAGSGAVGTGPGFFAPYNFWIGQPDVGIAGTVSGSDSGWQSMYMGIDMQLRMNRALRIRGNYHLGSWGDVAANGGREAVTVASEYPNSRFPGVQQSFSPGYWNTLWLSATLPWGTLSLGKRPSDWGTGLSYNGTESRSSESLALRTHSGPLTVQISLHPSRRGDVGDVQYYNPDVDKNNARIWDIIIPSILYRCRELDIGLRVKLQARRSGGEAFVGLPQDRMTQLYRDRTDSWYAGYCKYYTGRFFFNTEALWFEQTVRNRQKDGGGAFRGVRDTYIDHWRFVVDASVLAGPARLAILFSWLQGDDRRGGQFANGIQALGNVTYIDRRGTLRRNSFANTGLFRPYSLLQCYTYGAGMFVNANTGIGYIGDAVVYAARADYSLAANLNTFLTFFWAERQSKSGFGWGCIAPDTANRDGSIVRRGTDQEDRVGAPNIPDSFLGWEIDAGVDWQFLEGMVLSTTFAYWQPGGWYRFACIDKSVANWDIAGPPGSTNPADWGINPDRTIDPVWRLQFVISGQF